jgi:carbonic anhydrase
MGFAIFHKPDQLVGSWPAAQRFLTEGNQRFVNNQTITRDSNDEDRKILQDGQKPFAVIVTCSDSRVAPEIYFDQKLGDIFVIRNAGNIADKTTLGSIEYAVGHLHTPLVVVVGHGKCGAVTAAFQQLQQSDGQAGSQSGGGEHTYCCLNSILDQIRPGIKDKNIDDAINDNINNTVTTIKNNEIVISTGAKVLGANYNIATGKITWIG